jgi:hypothetical protein
MYDTSFGVCIDMNRLLRTVPPDFIRISTDLVLLTRYRTFATACGAHSWLDYFTAQMRTLYHKTHPKNSPTSYYTRTSRIVLVLFSIFKVLPVDNVDSLLSVIIHLVI